MFRITPTFQGQFGERDIVVLDRKLKGSFQVTARLLEKHFLDGSAGVFHNLQGAFWLENSAEPASMIGTEGLSSAHTSTWSAKGI